MTDDRTILALSGELQEDLRAARIRRRGVYSTQAGLEELARQVVQLGAFSTLDPADPAMVERHNVAINILDDLGLLDSSRIADVIRYMLSLPAMPDAERNKE